MNKHTPGPWKVRQVTGPGYPGQIGYVIDFTDDQEQITDFVYEQADAVLIAAAPDLLEALICAADALWEDSREVHMDSTMMFGHGYDWDGWNDFRWEMHAKCGSFAIWPTGYPRVWSAYGGNDGSYWNQCFSSEAEAKAAMAKYITSIEPDHPAAKAYAAIAKAKGEQA